MAFKDALENPEYTIIEPEQVDKMAWQLKEMQVKNANLKTKRDKWKKKYMETA